MSKSSRCYNRLIWILCLMAPVHLLAQNNLDWKEIELIDTLSYTSFGINKLENPHYPPSQLFDGNFKTCWVSKLKNGNPVPSLFVKMPDNTKTVNIFAGYGKTHDLYYQNSQPKTIKLSIWGAINPDGFVSEVGALYKSVKYPEDTLVHVIDTFDIQSINLSAWQTHLANFKNDILEAYTSTFKMPMSEFCYILQLEILDEWPGTKYGDICISELFFGDRLIEPEPTISVDSIYFNKEENTLMAGLKNKGSIVLYMDINAIIQLGEISENRKWVILLSMPPKFEGRSETTYLLLNLSNGEMVNHKLQTYSQDYIYGSPIYFEETDHVLYLVYKTLEDGLRKIELVD